jgi:nicotinamidase-related amidase
MQMNRQALIVIDIQNDYFPGGAMALENPEAAANNAAALLADFRERKQPIVHIQHESTVKERGFLLPGTTGQLIHKSVTPIADEVVFTKHFPNSFWQTPLEAHLRELQVDSVLLAGMMTHMCVSTTARGAMERGFKVQIATDACTTRALMFMDEEINAATVHKTALAEIASYTELVSTASILR